MRLRASLSFGIIHAVNNARPSTNMVFRTSVCSGIDDVKLPNFGLWVWLPAAYKVWMGVKVRVRF